MKLFETKTCRIYLCSFCDTTSDDGYLIISNSGAICIPCVEKLNDYRLKSNLQTDPGAATFLQGFRFGDRCKKMVPRFRTEKRRVRTEAYEEAMRQEIVNHRLDADGRIGEDAMRFLLAP